MALPPLRFTLTLLALSAVSLLGAEERFLRTMGPASFGQLIGLDVNPKNPDSVITAIDMGLAYRTSDGGKHWELCGGSTFANINPAFRGGLAVAYNPVNPAIVYMASVHGLYKSEDGGKRWQLMQGGTPDYTFGAIALDPAHPEIVYVATGMKQNSVIRWGLHSIARSPDGGKTLEWLTRPGGEKKADPSPERSYFRIVIDPRSPLAGKGKGHQRLYLCGTGGLWRSDDYGKSWVDLEKNVPGAEAYRQKNPERSLVCDLALLPDGTLLAVKQLIIKGEPKEDGIFASANHGATWRRWEGSPKLTSGADSYCQIAVSPKDPQRIYFSTTYAVYGTRDGGKHWRRLTDHRCQWMRFEEKGGTISTDNFPRPGGNFKENETGVWNINHLVVAPSDPDCCYFADGNGLSVTHDGGKSWEHLFLRYGEKVQPPALPEIDQKEPSSWTHAKLARGNNQLVVPNQIAFDPFDARRIAVAYYDIGLNLSDDGGTSWRWAHSGITAPERHQMSAVAFDPVRKGTLYAGGGKNNDGTGIFRSDDAGFTFTATRIPALVEAAKRLKRPWNPRVNHLLAEKGRLWASTSYGLALSEGDGEWRMIPSLRGCDVNQLSRLKNGALFAAVRRAEPPAVPGLYQSRDHGKTFTRIQPETIGGVATYSASAADESIQVITAQKPGAGPGVWEPFQLWKSTDGGKSWTNLNTLRAAAAAVDPRNPRKILLAVWAKDVAKEPCGILVSRDGGKSFQPVEPDLPIALESSPGNDFTFHPTIPGRWYFSSGAGLYEFQGE